MGIHTETAINRKLMWMSMLASGSALLLACVAYVATDVVTFRSSMARNLAAQADIVALNAASALVFNDPEAAAETLASLQVKSSIRAAGIYHADGRVFAAYRVNGGPGAESLPDRLTDQSSRHSFADGSLALVRPMASAGRVIGAVYLRSDLRELHERLWLYGVVSVAVLIASMIVALLLSSRLQRGISRPILDLTAAVRRISESKDYSVRVLVTSRDEIGQLAVAFNEMLARIGELNARLEQRVIERTTQLQAANRELEAFCYSISHDLRTPLRSIDGFSQALAEDCGAAVDENGRQYIARIQAATGRMGQLIEDLLNLSRVTRSELVRSQIDLSDIARKIFAELGQHEPQRRVRVVVQDGIAAEGDARLLRIALENLISNAWKFTGREAEAVISFGVIREPGRQTYYINDNGVGFDMAYVDKLFGAFQRLHGVRDFPGTGIGLATVQRIVHRHGGRIWVQAEPGKGATFYFTLVGGTQ